MDSRLYSRVAIVGVSLICAISAHAQLLPPTTTPTAAVPTTTQEVFSNIPTKTSDATSVTISQAAVTDLETMRHRIAGGGTLSSALQASGLFKSASLLSTTESVIVSQIAGCETFSSRQFYYVQPETRLRNVDPFLVEAQIVNVRPLDARCTSNRVDVTMKGPFKTYQKVRSAGSGRADDKMRNFFEVKYGHDAANAQITFNIANDSYQQFLKKMQLGGLISNSSVLNNAAVLAVVGPKLQNMLVGINGGGLQ